MNRISDYLSNEEKNTFFQTYKREWTKEYECMNPSCNNKIKGRKNHLLQENGVLNFVSEDNKLYSYEGGVFGKPLVFKSTTKHRCMRANVLCTMCDDKLFRSIEKVAPDYNSLKTFYLFSLRVLIWEMRKQDFNISLNEKCVKLFSNKSFVERVLKQIKENKFMSVALKRYEQKYFRTSHPKIMEEKLKYKVRFIPKVEVGLCSHVSLVVDGEKKFFIHGFFIHIIPMKTKSVLMIGTDIDKHEWINSKDNMSSKNGTFIDRFYDNFETYDNKTLQKYISFFMLEMSEDWVCSERFYLKYIKPKEETILSVIRSSFNDINKFSISNKLIESGDTLNIFKN